MTWVYEKFWWSFMRYFVLDVLIYLWVSMEKNICISIRLNCIWWFKRCHGCMCLYTCILWSSGIFVCLYDQVIMSLIFLFEQCQVWMCMYTCILRSSEIFVCLYNQAMKSLIFMLRDTCMLVFPEIVECMYTRIAKLLDIYV
jgi:hypothetical protein